MARYGEVKVKGGGFVVERQLETFIGPELWAF